MKYQISYGKKSVPVYRVQALPLHGLQPIPESTFTGRSNRLFAAEVDITIHGDDFLPAYLVGDNSNVVATDSMKNIIIQRALEFQGSTLEHYLYSVATYFLKTYGHIRDVELEARDLGFSAVQVATADGAFAESDRLYAQHVGHTARTRLHVTTQDGIVQHESGVTQLRLMKLTGSAFTSFVRDANTTLPDRKDRPLFIYLDLFWTYQNPEDGFLQDTSRYVAAEQIVDLVNHVFHSFVSESIQHLVHEFGQCILTRFPQIQSVRFVAQNRTRDPFGQSDTYPEHKVYSDPFPAFGEITLSMSRES